MTTATASEATEKAAELAKENKIALGDVKFDGPRITVQDVQKAIAAKDSSSGSSSGGSSKAKGAKADAAKMPERAHHEGCPMPDDRVEIYDVRVPAKVDSNGQVVKGSGSATMAHCVECGATTQISS